MILKGKRFKTIAFGLYVLILIFIHVLILKYIYNFINDANGIKHYASNMFLFLDYVFFMFKMYILIVEPETYEYDKKIVNKTHEQITSMKNDEIQLLRTDMKKNFICIVKFFFTIDILNTIFCIILKKTVETTIIYNQIIYSINIVCSFLIYWKIMRYYTLREIDTDIDQLFITPIISIQ